MRELGGVQALVVGALAEHSADVHTLVDGLTEAANSRTSHDYLVDPSKAKGAAKALLYTIQGLRRGSLERPVSTPAVTSLLRRRPSDCVPGRRKLCRHLQRRPGGDPHAGRSL
jgi:hypothetical protein